MYRSGRYWLLDPGSFARWNYGMAKMQENMSQFLQTWRFKLKKRESLFWGEEEEEEENQFSNYLPLSL
jgi:hypothetical protein